MGLFSWSPRQPVIQQAATQVLTEVVTKGAKKGLNLNVPSVGKEQTRMMKEAKKEAYSNGNIFSNAVDKVSDWLSNALTGTGDSPSQNNPPPPGPRQVQTFQPAPK